ncbi:MAG: hypothetical protein HC918_11560 [Oscillatoriales cyanobacterium SM2_1_8]|nr:hypothetical protein [Oscillatoriales cyanobacterium SM2_1_8]
MSLDPKEIIACAKHIAEDSNRGFWMKLGAQTFETLLRMAQFIVSALTGKSEGELSAAMEQDVALKVMMEQMQQMAAANQQFAEMAKEALKQPTVVNNAKLADNIGAVVQGGTATFGDIHVGGKTETKIEKQINVKQEGSGNTQTNTFN